jgi:hypothetical protein
VTLTAGTLAALEDGDLAEVAMHIQRYGRLHLLAGGGSFGVAVA